MFAYSTQTDSIILICALYIVTVTEIEIDDKFDVFPIRQIIVPYDNSKYSDRAIKFALTLAQKFDSYVTTLTILNSDIHSRAFTNMKNHQTVIDRTGHQKLNKKLKSFENSANKLNISLKSDILVSSSIAQSILSFTISKKADLIVMGTRGKGSAPSYMRLGSVAIDVSQASHCPVVFIK